MTENDDRKKPAGCLGTATLFVIVSAMVFGLYSYFHWMGSDRDKAARLCSDTTMAFVMSQGFVKRQIRSPSTASFPYITSEGVSSRKAGDCEFNVRAYVDAQNAFGATIRTRYTMKLRYDSQADSWRGRDLVLD